MRIQKGCKRNVRKAICAILLCSLAMAGCGRIARPGGPQGNQEGWTKQGKEQTQEHTREQSDMGESTQTAREILARLVEDEGFCEKVWYAAEIEEGDTEEIIVQKLAQCSNLVLQEEAYGKEIHSLEALALLPNLENLTIDIQSWDGSRIKDFTPIAELSNLRQLYIEYDTGEEINLSFLAAMDTVTVLYLPNCRIADISFLEEMPQLERLSLYETPVEDLAVLEKLPELVELALSGNSEAKHIEAVGSLLKMRELGLQDCGIEDISFLSGLTQLRGVNLNSNLVTDLSPLAGLTDLEQLGAAHNRISDISPLAGLTNLFNLSLDENEIRDISALAGMNRLNQLGLTGNQIQDLSPLVGKEELCYVAVYDNPCEDLSPVWQAPLLNLLNAGVSDEQREIVSRWMEEKRPDLEEYECIDFVEGDLDRDGRQDVAFLVNGDFQDGDSTLAYDNNRRLFVLLQQSDGSFKELEDAVSVPDAGSGGMRGDPYRGMWMGRGCLMVANGWGSSSGIDRTEIYLYRQGELSLSQSISVMDYFYSEGYDVSVTNEEDGSWQRYVIAMDGERLVRVDLADSDHIYHRAFPDINLFLMSYRIDSDRPALGLSSAAALEVFLEDQGLEMVKEELPYVSWQKEGYERLIGVELPDHYYVMPGKEETHYIYYNGVTVEEEGMFHLIYCVEGDSEKEYRLNDLTGEITEVSF